MGIVPGVIISTWLLAMVSATWLPLFWSPVIRTANSPDSQQCWLQGRPALVVLFCGSYSGASPGLKSQASHHPPASAFCVASVCYHGQVFLPQHSDRKAFFPGSCYSNISLRSSACQVQILEPVSFHGAVSQFMACVFCCSCFSADSDTHHLP